MRTALFWPITQDVVVILYRRFRTIYRSHLQGSRIQEHQSINIKREDDLTEAGRGDLSFASLEEVDGPLSSGVTSSRPFVSPTLLPPLPRCTAVLFLSVAFRYSPSWIYFLPASPLGSGSSPPYV